jgi:hypothetical protein
LTDIFAEVTVLKYQTAVILFPIDVDLLMIVAALGVAGLGLWRREYHLIIDCAVTYN